MLYIRLQRTIVQRAVRKPFELCIDANGMKYNMNGDGLKNVSRRLRISTRPRNPAKGTIQGADKLWGPFHNHGRYHPHHPTTSPATWRPSSPLDFGPNAFPLPKSPCLQCCQFNPPRSLPQVSMLKDHWTMERLHV